MVLTLGAGQYLLDVVETPDHARPQIEALRHEALAPVRRRLQRVEPRPQNVVDDYLERNATLPPFPLQPGAHVIVQGQRGPHPHDDINLMF